MPLSFRCTVNRNQKTEGNKSMNTTRVGGMMLIIYLAMVLIIMFGSGCASYQAEDFQEMVSRTEQLNQTVETLQATVVPAVETLSEQGLISAETAEKTKDISGEIDTVQGHITQVTESLAQQEFTQDGTAGLIEAAVGINNATKPFNPYWPITSGVLSVVSVVASAIAKKKSTEVVKEKQERAVVDKALTETVKGLETAKRDLKDNTEALDTIKTSLKQSQVTSETRQIVTKIRAEAA